MAKPQTFQRKLKTSKAQVEFNYQFTTKMTKQIFKEQMKPKLEKSGT